MTEEPKVLLWYGQHHQLHARAFDSIDDAVSYGARLEDAGDGVVDHYEIVGEGPILETDPRVRSILDQRREAERAEAERWTVERDAKSRFWLLPSEGVPWREWVYFTSAPCGVEASETLERLRRTFGPDRVSMTNDSKRPESPPV